MTVIFFPKKNLPNLSMCRIIAWNLSMAFVLDSPYAKAPRYLIPRRAHGRARGEHPLSW
jgi:hypothetical protein